MKNTEKQSKALALAFNNKFISSMKPDEYKEYIQTMLVLSLQTTRANYDDKFVVDFINSALSKPIDFIAQQAVTH